MRKVVGCVQQQDPPPLWLRPSDLWAQRREVASSNPPLSFLFGFLLDFSISYAHILWSLGVGTCVTFGPRDARSPQPTARPSKVARPQTVKVTFQFNLYPAATPNCLPTLLLTRLSKKPCRSTPTLLWKPQYCNNAFF